eukprot:TRINITY_DN13741_c0_g1_i3.p1 TRINITY_DN13741_c0_g1~~TRINITY_DN13741_c0_g1_i3.p1  ORF type:complete len:1319 (-),score=324.07 TRINITY_DN13741_c0_g1_i3:291-3713(-)
MAAATSGRRASSSGSLIKRQTLVSHTGSMKSGSSSASSSAGSTTASESRRSSSAGSLGKSKKPVAEKAKTSAKTPGTAPAAPATAEDVQKAAGAEGAVPAVPLSWSSSASSPDGGPPELSRRRASRASAVAPQVPASQPTPSSSSSLRQRSNSLTNDAGSSTPRLRSGADRRASSGSPLRRSSTSSTRTTPADLYELARPLLEADESQEQKALALGAMARALRAGSSPVSWKGPETPLRASVTASNAEMARLLLEARADPNEQDGKGVSVLHNASFEGLASLCKTLLEARADANAADQHGQTAMFFSPTDSVCDLLLEHKADANAVNQKGQSALHLASRAGITEVLAWLSSKVSREVIELRDMHGATAAYYARHAGVSSDFLTRHKLLVTDPQAAAASLSAAASSRRRQSVGAGSLLPENQEPRGRSRQSVMLGSSLARSPLPPLLEGQQDSEDEDDSEAATDIRPAIAGEAELAESEEELGSSSTIVPVVDSPSTAARPALSAHPPAETEADKLHEASLAPTQEMSGAGSRAENGKTSEIAEASKEDADRIVLSPREATIAETTPQELNGLEALSETTTADHFELSQAADTTSVTTEAGSILEGLSAAERPMTAGLEASDDTLPVQEVPEVRESQVESKRETPVQHPGSDEDSRKEVEAAEAEATTTVAERYGGSAAARTKKSGEAKMQQHIGKEAGATAANVCRKDASFEVFAQTPKESHEDEGGKSSMAHDDKMKVYAGATEEACSVEAKRKSGAGAEAIRAASEGEEKEAAGTEAKWNCHDGTKVAKRAKPVESEFAAPGEVKTTRAEAESSGQEQIGAATKVEVQAQWKDSEKAEGERSEYSEQEKTETAATPGNETRKVDAEQKTQARTEAAEAEASWQQVKEAEEAARAAGEACLDGAGQGAYADAAAVNEEEACTGREEAGEAGGHADEACQVEADQKVHEKAETTCQQAQQIDEIERPAMRACNAETDGETPKEAGAAEAHVQDDCEDAARAAEEACKVESWRRTCGNTQAAKAMQDDAENPEEEQPSKQSHCRGKDESLHASRMAADKMVTWEEDLGEGGDARESGKARPVAVSDVEQQDCLNLNSPAVVLETPAPMSPATGSPSPESPAEFKGRLARRERRASLSQGLR